MLSAARATARANEARIGPVSHLPDPQLQLGFMNRDLPSFSLNDPLGMTTIQVTQMLPFPGKLGAAGHAAEQRAAAGQEVVNGVVWELRSRAAMAFYDLYRADRSAAIAVDSRRLLQNLAQTTQAMYAVGQGQQPDVLRAQVEVESMSEEIIRMQAMRESMAARLNAMLGRPIGDTLAVPVLPAFPGELAPLDSLEQLALANQPQLKSGALEVQAASEKVRWAGREIWPDLELGVQYGQRPMTGGGTDRMLSFMLGVSVPIWAGSRQTQMKREAEAMRDMATADLAAQQVETRSRVGEGYASLRQSRALISLYRHTILPQAEATAAAALAAYRTGSVNFMTVLDAQVNVNRYRQEVVQLEAEQGKAIAELEMLTGSPLLDPDSAADAAGVPQ
jgi:outer membrane protein TolC